MRNVFRIIVMTASLFLIFSRLLKTEEILPPKVEAHSAILIDQATGRVLWEKDAYAPMSMASTTKIMTAILALELGRPSDIAKVSKRAAAAPRMKMNLQAGEEISLESLLYALMLESANDAAVVIAEHISGSVEQFCIQMTQKAQELGAKDTVFKTPNGLDSENHHSTAYDMAQITRYALTNPEFVRIINTRQIDLKSSRTTYSMHNKNRMLNEFEGATGVKTGYTGKAGYCFVGSAKRDDMQLISVVFASGWGPKGREQKWTDSKHILDFGFEHYEYHDIIVENEQVGVIDIVRSKTHEIPVKFARPLNLPMTAEELEKVEILPSYPLVLQAPVEADAIVGAAKIYIDDELVDTIELITVSYAERHDFMTSLRKLIDYLTK